MAKPKQAVPKKATATKVKASPALKHKLESIPKAYNLTKGYSNNPTATLRHLQRSNCNNNKRWVLKLS